MLATIFIAFLALFVIIGVVASARSQPNATDYFLAGREVSPLLTALSAAATNNSGFMFIGFIGFTYTLGLPAMWMLVGFWTGDYLMSLKVYPQIRTQSAKRDALSYAGLLARWTGGEMPLVRLVVALLTLVFLTLYAAAQFRAGGKAFHILFAWPEYTGILLGGAVVFAYCLFGGLRASIWTDAAQAILMMLSMALLACVCVMTIGGLGAMEAALPQGHLTLFPSNMMLGVLAGPLLFILGWIAGGVATAGQPHIMARFLAMDSAQNIGRFRLYYYSWLFVFYALAVIVGLVARAVLPDAANFDAELALPVISLELLPVMLAGVALSGLFASTISTADSQIISCSTVLAHDLLPENKRLSLNLARLGTAIVSIAAIAFALGGGGTIFSLVLIAWSGMGAAFVPLLLVYVSGGRPTQKVIIAMMTAGVAATVLWRIPGWEAQIYEVLPGLAAGLAVYGLWRLWPARAVRPA